MLKRVFFILLLTALLLPTTVSAWNDCPYGKIDDTYPGECGRYLDTNNDGVCDHSQRDPETISIDSGQDIADNQEREIEEESEGEGRDYKLIPIVLALFLLYSISYSLARKDVINVVQHRKIWNMLLLISFLVSGLSGILLALRIEYELSFSLPFGILGPHVKAGIDMVVIGCFHVGWHWRYFKHLLD